MDLEKIFRKNIFKKIYDHGPRNTFEKKLKKTTIMDLDISSERILKNNDYGPRNIFEKKYGPSNNFLKY